MSPLTSSDGTKNSKTKIGEVNQRSDHHAEDNDEIVAKGDELIDNLYGNDNQIISGIEQVKEKPATTEPKRSIRIRGPSVWWWKGSRAEPLLHQLQKVQIPNFILSHPPDQNNMSAKGR